MTKHYDADYFQRWYRDGDIGGAPRLARKVALAVAVAEYHLERPIRTVLDIGCGEGAWRAPLLKLRPKLQYLGFDSSEYAVRRYGRTRNLHMARFGDFAWLRPCAPVDLLVCSDVMHYVPDRELRAGLAGVDKAATSASVPAATDFLRSVVPSNVFAAAVNDQILPLTLFTAFFALAMTRIEPARRETLADFFQSIEKTMLVMIGYPIYFVLRRRCRTDHLGGLWCDMCLLLPWALYFVIQGPLSPADLQAHPGLYALIPVLGAISASALIAYVLASRMLPFSLFGLLSYVEPVLLVGVALLLGETIGPDQWLTYLPIWLAVLLVGWDSARLLRRQARQGL